MYLLFPGRHHLLTNFQFKYLNQIILSGLEKEFDVVDNPIGIKEKIEGVIFAVTSANHSNTRRNPVPFYLRALAIQEFANQLHIPAYIFGIDDVGNLDNFASYTIKRIQHESDGLVDINDGDLTATRDYNSYVRQMDEIAQQKHDDVAAFIKPGRIGDIGCAVGSWMKLACEDVRLRESDFYGIEVSRHLFDICQQRKHNGEFSNPFVFFSQKNAVTGLVFQKRSMDTVFTSSLTHEIESYGGRQDLLNFIANRYQELAHGGVWVNRDVVGPENANEEVYVWLNKEDGSNDSFDKEFTDRTELSHYLNSLSTYSTFSRFVRDFRRKEGFQLNFEKVLLEGKISIKTSLNNATEFMTKKDYHDNWQSEMHETFCFWSFSDWKQHMEEVGFSINTQSKIFTNDWIADNRWKESVQLFKLESSELIPQKYPVTTMFLIAEKK